MSTPEPTAADREKAREIAEVICNAKFASFRCALCGYDGELCTCEASVNGRAMACIESVLMDALAAVRAETVEQIKRELLEAEFIIAHTHDWQQFPTVAEREQYTLKKLKILERYHRCKPSPPKAGVWAPILAGSEHEICPSP